MRNGKYELVVAPDNYPGKTYRNKYVYEHHLVWWTHNNSLVPQGFVIHHKNGNQRDNNLLNLELISESEHRKHHGTERTNAALQKAVCFNCNNEFQKIGSKIRYSMKLFGKVFCGRFCQVSYQQKKRHKSK